MVDILDSASVGGESIFSNRTADWAAEAVLDLRDAPPPSLYNETFPGSGDRYDAVTPGACSRSSSRGPGGNTTAAEPLMDLEQLLQALLFEGGLLEDEEPRIVGGDDEPVTPSFVSGMRRHGAISGLQEE